MCDSGQSTYPLGLNFLICEMEIYKKDLPQRILVRINEVACDMCLAFPGVQHMLNKVYLFVSLSKRVYERNE